MKRIFFIILFILAIFSNALSETITTTYSETDNLYLSTTVNVPKYVNEVEMYIPVYIVGHITAITSDGAPKEITVAREVGEVSPNKLSSKELYLLIEGDVYKEAFAELYLTAIGENVKE